MQIQGSSTSRSIAEITIEPKPGDASLMIVLSESVPGNLYPWFFDVDVMTLRGRMRLGTFSTVPSAYGAPGSRVVAIATAPGALNWNVTPRAAAGAIADLDLSTGPSAGQPGLVVLSTTGHALPTRPPRVLTPTALAQQALVSAGKTRWFFLRGFRSGGAGVAFLQLFDSATLPAAGALPVLSELVLPNQAVFVPANANGAPLDVQTGLAWAISSAPAVYTPYPASEFWLRTAYD